MMQISVIRMLLRWLNPVRVYRGLRASREEEPVARSELDPELRLYDEILGHGHLHYGYFEDTGLDGEEISLADLRDAQRAYAELLLRQLRDHDRPVLDCGCGTGGLLELLSERGYRPVGVTPDRAQCEALWQAEADLQVHHDRFEDLDTGRHADTYGTVICSESFQYLELGRAFEVAGQILAPDGRWVICDYFRRHDRTHEDSGHLLDAFREAAETHGWSVLKERDITENVLGTLKYAYSLADQLGRPLVEFAIGKLRTKHPLVHHQCLEELEALGGRLEREMKTIEPERFRRDKTYRLFVLERD